MERTTAEQLIRQSMASQALTGFQLTPVATLEGKAYDFDPRGWWLYTVTRSNELRIGGTEYVAIHPDSGNIRHLGILGE